MLCNLNVILLEIVFCTALLPSLTPSLHFLVNFWSCYFLLQNRAEILSDVKHLHVALIPLFHLQEPTRSLKSPGDSPTAAEEHLFSQIALNTELFRENVRSIISVRSRDVSCSLYISLSWNLVNLTIPPSFFWPHYVLGNLWVEENHLVVLLRCRTHSLGF